jgi:hypothetical protein
MASIEDKITPVEIQRGFSEGWFLQPNIQYIISNPSAPYDPQKGKPIGDWEVRSPDKVHTLFVPEDIKERRAFLLKILQDRDTLPEELNGKLMYKKSDGSRGGGFRFDQFCELSFKQLAEVQKNAYYTDTRGNLRTKEGAITEYNRANKRIEAIS